MKQLQIMLQAEKSDLPENYGKDDRIVNVKDVDEDTKFLYAGFEKYSEELRNELKERFDAFEVNTIYEKEI